ncbi:MAG: hypothetical protein SF052_14740 [Bacteroidia bacterium]|nr:hypothetical protein [Bacteroidia bacterium]
MQRRFALLWILTVCFFLSINAQQNVSPLFASDELLQITLETDLKKFLNDRGGDPSYHDAKLSLTDANGKIEQGEVEIKARGRFRRDELTCHYPPIRVKFSKKKESPAVFKGQTKLKLVTHCADEQFVLREYYIYKVYNLITERSFRVRLAKIKYVDTQGEMPTEEAFSFFIEDEEDMALRNGENAIGDDVPITYEDVDENQVTLVHIFNYMIANRDFRIPTPSQNMKIITQGNAKPTPVPYDFDWSGMVDASYTKLTGEAGPTYEDRQNFKPLCRTKEEYEVIFGKLREIEDDIENLYKNSPYLDSKVIKESLKYYKDFYKTINNPKKVEEIFVQSCKAVK